MLKITLWWITWKGGRALRALLCKQTGFTRVPRGWTTRYHMHKDSLYLCFCILLKSRLDTISREIFVFVFLYFDQVWKGYHMHKDSLYLCLCNLLKSRLNTIHRDSLYLYFCVLTKSGRDTIFTLFLCICISVICSSQDWIPYTEIVCICTSVFCSSPDWIWYAQRFLYLDFCVFLKSRLHTM